MRCALPPREANRVTTYSGGRQIDRAQVVLDRHTVLSANGCCAGCGGSGSCPQREEAVRVFRRSLRLPRRNPGATLPELINARRIGGPALFGASSRALVGGVVNTTTCGSSDGAHG